MDSIYSKAHIRESLNPSPSSPDEDMLWLAGGSREMLAKVRATAPAQRIPAAVLVPLVERSGGWTVLLTQRAATLKDHAGQISFPGGRMEPEDADPWQAALREAQEEIGLAPSFVEFAGYLPDHWVGTGFRVTPAVAFVNPAFELRIATAEVHDVFEVPLDYILDAANHKTRQLRMGELTLEVYDIPFGPRTIWGATAGMLMTFRRRLQGPQPAQTARPPTAPPS
ncbi:MAG TPA: CoA pyrophosphatase [Steroidobacteraceae bacterium]|jgi:8-oxo-dGTP pyrophosphatase MutT (NUDIX family)|nr:CoA pyrophosphatase [Steroidobacteraceae bacterium]